MDTTMPSTVFNERPSRNKIFSRLTRAGGYLTQVWQRAGRKPVAMARIVGEMAVLRCLNGLPPSDYLLGHLDRADILWDEKWNHLGHRQYEEFLWQLNDPAYRKISQNKLAEKALLETLGLPTPRFRGLFSACAGRCSAGSALKSAKDLELLFLSLLSPHTTRNFCFKELEGWAGSGFRPVEVKRINDQVGITDLSDRRAGSIPIDEFIEQFDPKGEYLIEDYIDQHPAYADIHPSSINGYRFWVLNEGQGKTGVPFANLRFGRKGSLVDNGADRIMAPINPETGQIDKGYELTLDRPEHLRHPDTGVPIAGRKMPYFAEARQLAIDSLAVFPHMNFAGVDIAVSKAGPVVLELNNHPGGRGTLVGRKPMRQVFTRALAGLEGEL